MLGGYEDAGTINQIFYGWIGDVRIVDPLAVNELGSVHRNASFADTAAGTLWQSFPWSAGPSPVYRP